MNIAIVSIGYGDGYPRAYIKPNFVAIDEQLVPVIGRVSMDMIAIDVTHIKTESAPKLNFGANIVWSMMSLPQMERLVTNYYVGLSNRPIRKVI